MELNLARMELGKEATTNKFDQQQTYTNQIFNNARKVGTASWCNHMEATSTVPESRLTLFRFVQRVPLHA